jgi:hypothetical protein
MLWYIDMMWTPYIPTCGLVGFRPPCHPIFTTWRPDAKTIRNIIMLLYVPFPMYRPRHSHRSRHIREYHTSCILLGGFGEFLVYFFSTSGVSKPYFTSLFCMKKKVQRVCRACRFIRNATRAARAGYKCNNNIIVTTAPRRRRL